MTEAAKGAAPQALNQQALGLVDHLWNAAQRLTQVWSLIQIGVILALVLAALLATRRTAPRYRDWIAGQDQSSHWIAVHRTILRELGPIVFAVLAAATTFVLRQTTWPSHSYFVGIAAELAAIWVLAHFVTQLIASRYLRRIVAVGIWSWFALQMAGLSTRLIEILDSLSIQIGQTRLSVLVAVKAAIVTALLIRGAALVSSVTETRLARVDDISPSMRVLVGKLVRVGLFTLAIVVGVQSVGFDLTALTVFSGAIGLGLGFGLQKVVSNLVSGFILLLDKSVKPGDVISLGETFGWISSLGARYVSVVTRDGREFLIPNEDLITNRVINWSYSNKFVRLEAPFGVAYDADPHLVRRLAVEAAKAVERVKESPPPVCHLVGFGDSSVDFLVRFWINDPSSGVVNVKGEVLLALWDAFKAHGITIPFPQRDLHMKGSVVIERGARPAPTPPAP